MANTNLDSVPEQLPRLLVPQSQAEEKLTEQLKIGEELRDRPIGNESGLKQARDDRSRWKDYVTLMIRKFVSPLNFAEPFQYSSGGRLTQNPSLDDRILAFRNHMRESVNELRSIIERLPLIDEMQAPILSGRNDQLNDPTVFIVHGHDEAALDTVAGFVRRLSLQPIILHEQLNHGQTIIEKFEGHSAVGYAIVLLTPDDVGGKDEKTLQSRARQNVILELGFFLGTLTRNKVCALVKGKLELPSDYDGVLYIPFDDSGKWKMDLAREMKGAGLPVDLNDAFAPPAVLHD